MTGSWEPHIEERVQSLLGDRVVEAPEAVSGVRSGDRVFVQGGHATSVLLLEALVARARSLSNVEVMHLHSVTAHPHVSKELAGHVRHNALFAGSDTRAAIQAGLADYTPAFLSDVPVLIRSGRLKVDVALLQVSPPDAHGYCSLGPSVDIAPAALEHARLVVAEINPQVPRTHGEGLIHVRRIHRVVRSDHALPVLGPPPVSPEVCEIGRLVAGLVEDGSTLQIGIGAVPAAVLEALGGKHHLGIHSELITDGVADLAMQGVITGRHKTVDPGLIVATFVLGSQKVLDFIADNPGVHLASTDRVNDPGNIRRQDRMVAINSAIEIDLTGQVAAESLGPVLYSGVGGQLDFMRGAALSRGGKPIVALPSTAQKGQASRITPMLALGAAVTTSRAHVHYVVTEYGVADLFGKTLKERGEALTAIAHPDFQPDLRRWMKECRSFILAAPDGRGELHSST